MSEVNPSLVSEIGRQIAALGSQLSTAASAKTAPTGAVNLHAIGIQLITTRNERMVGNLFMEAIAAGALSRPEHLQFCIHCEELRRQSASRWAENVFNSAARLFARDTFPAREATVVKAGTAVATDAESHLAFGREWGAVAARRCLAIGSFLQSEAALLVPPSPPTNAMSDVMSLPRQCFELLQLLKEKRDRREQAIEDDLPAGWGEDAAILCGKEKLIIWTKVLAGPNAGKVEVFLMDKGVAALSEFRLRQLQTKGITSEPNAKFADVPPGAGSAGSARGKLKEPSEVARAAYARWFVTGETQEKIAAFIRHQFRRPATQGDVSRWLGEARDWVSAGNVLPGVSDTSTTPAKVVDPSKIEMGRRERRTTLRQRHRDDSEES